MKAHDVDGLDCWCSPTYLIPCECEDGCWKCEDGLEELSREQAERAPETVIVVHNPKDAV